MPAMKRRFKKYNRPHRCSGCGQTGHRIETCPNKNKKSTCTMKSGTKATKGTKQPKTLSNLDKQVSYANRQPTQFTRGLRRLEQMSYPDVCALTEDKAKSKLKDMGLIPSLKGRKCWKCGTPYKHQASQGKSAFMCPRKKCRCKIRRGDLAYTPLWTKQSYGKGFSYKTYLQALYVQGLKVPQDSSQHLIGVKEKENDNWSHALRIATAYAELHTGREMYFPDGTLEFDGTTSATKKISKNKSKQVGRFIVTMHRETGKWALEPMNDKDVVRGAATPPESYEEVKGPVLRKAHAGHVASSDGARAFKKLAKNDLAPMGIPHATVVHGKREFSRVVRIPMSSLSSRLQKRVAVLPTTNTRSYRFKAGDQHCENLFGVIKRNLKRGNLAGRTARASINFLSAAWLARGPGLDAVAKGVAIYQNAITDRIHPKDAYKSTDWLRKSEAFPTEDS